MLLKVRCDNISQLLSAYERTGTLSEACETEITSSYLSFHTIYLGFGKFHSITAILFTGGNNTIEQLLNTARKSNVFVIV